MMLRTERLADETLWFTLNLEAWHAFAIWNREKPRVLFDEIPYFLDDEFSTRQTVRRDIARALLDEGAPV